MPVNALRIAFSTLAFPDATLAEATSLGRSWGYAGVELRLIDGQLIDSSMPAAERATGEADDRRRPLADCVRRQHRSFSQPTTLTPNSAGSSNSPTTGNRRSFASTAVRWPKNQGHAGHRSRRRQGSSRERSRSPNGSVWPSPSRPTTPSRPLRWLRSCWPWWTPGGSAPCGTPITLTGWEKVRPRSTSTSVPGSCTCKSRMPDAQRRHKGGWQLVPLGEGEVPVREIIGLLAAGGYGGYFSVEWEKYWHPEIEEPEIALPQHLKVLEEWVQDLAREGGV